MGFPSGQRDQTVNLTAQAFEGSNPSPTIVGATERAGAFGAHSAGRPNEKLAGVAQLVEHTLGKGEVIGSIPIVSSGNAVRR